MKPAASKFDELIEIIPEFSAVMRCARNRKSSNFVVPVPNAPRAFGPA